MSKPTVWMPFFVGDYLGDTMSFDTVEHGAYLLLILEYWRNGPLPNDMKTLGKICRLSNKSRSIVLQSVLLKFQLVGNEWRHKRIDLERQLANENQAIYVERAKKAAEARWKGHIQKDATSNATSTPNAMLENASPSPSPSIKKEITTLSPKKEKKIQVKVELVKFGKLHLQMEQHEMDSLVEDFGKELLRQEWKEMDTWIDKSTTKNGRQYRKPNHNHYLFCRNWLRDKSLRVAKPQQLFAPRNLTAAERSQQVLRDELAKYQTQQETNEPTPNSSTIDATFERIPNARN